MILGYFILILFFGCNSPQDKPSTVKIVDGNSLYDVYQPSEMSSLMKGMYAYNEQIKKDITKGKEREDKA